MYFRVRAHGYEKETRELSKAIESGISLQNMQRREEAFEFIDQNAPRKAKTPYRDCQRLDEVRAMVRGHR